MDSSELHSKAFVAMKLLTPRSDEAYCPALIAMRPLDNISISNSLVPFTYQSSIDTLCPLVVDLVAFILPVCQGLLLLSTYHLPPRLS